MAQTSLVGDLIQGLREMATDPCATLPAPSNVSVSVSGGTSTTNFWFVVTQLTPWGESAPCTEIAVTNALLTGTFTVTGTCSFAATAIKVYVTMAGSLQEDRYYLYTPGMAIGAFSIQFSLSSALVVGFPPSRSSAWLPDTDGSALSAASIYRWLNEGLDAATAITDGIRDVTGVPTTAGTAQYQLIGNWRKLSDGFYDGYPFAFGGKQDVFRHSNVTGITGTMVMNQDAQVQQVEIWPQAARTAGSGTLTSGISASATSLTFTPGSNGFVLGFGLVLLGPYPADPSSCEIVYYNTNVSNVLSPLTRGMGGTTAQAWPTGTLVTEMNIYLTGTRNPQHYAVGSASALLQLPPAWIDAMRTYLEARFKDAEQDDKGALQKMQEFERKCQGIKALRQTMGPRQIQVGQGSGVQTVVGAGGYFGGVIQT
jgi:hypothetical protein